ncbi:hypothetical protein ACFLU6_02680 [Acidobacteriota bacterium]
MKAGRSALAAFVGFLMILGGSAPAEGQHVMKPTESLGFGSGELTVAGTYSDRSLDNRMNINGRLTIGLPKRVDIFAEGVLMEDPLLGGGFSYQILDSVVEASLFGKILFPMEDGLDSTDRIYTAAALVGAGFATVDVWGGVEYSRTMGEDITSFLAGTRLSLLVLPFAVVAETGLGQDNRISFGLSMRF